MKNQVDEEQTSHIPSSETKPTPELSAAPPKVVEWVSPPARPLALGNPKEYQSFGMSGLIMVFGAQSIEGKSVSLGSRVKVTTEILPPTREDIEAMLAICLPPPDAPVFTVHWNDNFPPHCHLCGKRCRRDEEYYKYGGFSGHKRCAESLRRECLALANGQETNADASSGTAKPE